MNKILSVLFVCTGNSCRSIMAEGLLKKRLKELGKTHIQVHSAGTRAMDGLSPVDNTISVMSEAGVDVSDYKSTDLTNDMIRNSDLILVMEPTHKIEVLRRVPEASSKTYLLREFGKKNRESDYGSHEVIDPIGKSLEEYRFCLLSIKQEVERIAELL